MRDFRLDPANVEDIASAYEALLARPDVDGARSGLPGTCVGGAFALMAAATPATSGANARHTRQASCCPRTRAATRLGAVQWTADRALR